MKLSVLLASYNGKKFIAKQISSILEQLGPNDELIISDDGSNDGTLEIICSFDDKRLTLIYGPGQGINANFINAYENAKGDLILFSDQDDIWLPGRAELYREKLMTHDFVICDAEIIDEQGNLLSNSYFKKNHTKKTFMGNLIRCRTLGCCIGFRKNSIGDNLNIFNDYDTLPFDYSLTILSLFYFKVYFSRDVYHQYRRHNTNYSEGGENSKNSFWKMLIFRLRVLVFVYKAKKWLPSFKN
jgi:glycosyltransferase involved in cell wall biosynthesis|tara:strand:+ start:1283 stop:2008 length:726 start_codon:yes stop_codon:yes gene_type:complete